ncbi:MAG TPA: TolC family protein [Holophagaceae bacterium]|nr:TolC family protein [Holophagaceae bacterium]
MRPLLPFLSLSLLAQTGPAPVELRLTEKEAIALALRQGLAPQSARNRRDAIRSGIVQEQGAFDWSVGASLSVSRLESEDANPKTSGLNNLFFSDTRSTTYLRSFGASVEKLLFTGGTFSVSMLPTYLSQDITQANHTFGSSTTYPLAYDTQNPYGGRMAVALTQPLLRGFGPAATEARLRAARKFSEAGDLDYQRDLVREIALTDSLYWDFYFARQNLADKRTTLELARKQLEEDRERVQSGMLAPLELPAVEAAVLERERQVLSAQNLVETSRASLAAEILPETATPEILPSDEPNPVPQAFTLEEAERIALEERPELKATRADLQARMILETEAKNRTLPQLDATLAYLGGSATHDHVNPVLSDWSAGRYPGYYAGLQLRVPLGNHAARGALDRRRAERLAADLDSRALRQAILLEVRQSFSTLKASEKEVEALTKALEFREKSQEAEQEKLANGLSTSYFVLQRQDELDQARTALTLARTSYRKTLTAFLRAIGRLGAEWLTN